MFDLAQAPSPEIIELHSATVSIDPNGTDISMILKPVKRPLSHEVLTDKEESILVLDYLISEGFVDKENYRVTLIKVKTTK